MWVRRTLGMALGLQRVTQHLPSADTGQLIHIADQQQMRAGAIALTRVLASNTSSMLASSTTTRSASRGWSRSKAASPPGRSCSSRCSVLASIPASSSRRLAARPVGAARMILALLARARATMERTVKLLPQPGPPVRMATFCVSASCTASTCSGARVAPGLLVQPAQRRLPVDVLKGAQAILVVRAAGAASHSPARPRRDRRAPGTPPQLGRWRR